MSSKTFQTKYLVIGAGLAGLSSAYHLGDDYLIVEASDSFGGTAGTLNYKNFNLDNAVHILYFKQKEIKNWIVDQLNVSLIEKQKKKNAIWIKSNVRARFPLQYHLSELPSNSRVLASASILKTPGIFRRRQVYSNFEDYSLRVFGKYLTNIFVKPYNEKLFGVSLDKMNIDWMGDFVPEYSKSQMLLSVTGVVNRNYGRNAKYYYPSDGGISTIARGISTKLKISPVYNCSLQSISLNKKIATFSDGTEVTYKYLINTIPLDKFLEKIECLSQDISLINEKLKKNSTTLLHIYGKGNLNSKYDWIYVPEREIPFYRITIPGNINPKNCPDDHFALTLEFGGDMYQNQLVFDSSIKALKKMEILKENNSDFEFYWRLLDCSYVIYDSNREDALNNIFKFLRSNNIWSIGRYGGWEYSNMEDAIIHGKNVAEELLIKD